MLKKMKYAAIIGKINELHASDVDILGIRPKEKIYKNYSFRYTNLGILRLIFDYDKLNETAKQIVDGAVFQQPGLANYGGMLYSLNLSNGFNSEEEKLLVAKEWLDWCFSRGIYKGCRNKEEELFYFAFWAFMITEVDEMTRNEVLTELYDYFNAVGINNQEIKDIKEVIKIVNGTSELNELQCSKLETNSINLFESDSAGLGAEIVKIIKSERVLEYFSTIIYYYFGITGRSIAYNTYI